MSSAELPQAVEPKKKSSFKYTFTCAILATMTLIILGYDVGVLSGASLYIKEDLRITDVQLEILMGVINLYSLVGSFAAGRISDWIGRRYTIVLTAAIFLVAAALMGFASGYAMLMAGQFMAGVGMGYALTIVPVYTAEISPASLRGLLTSLPELSINLGILLGYVSNYVFARLPLRVGWRVMLGVSGAPSVLLAVAVFRMPESPRWLVMKGRVAEARAMLEKTSDSPEEAGERLADIKAAAGFKAGELDDDVAVMHVRKEGGGEENRVWRELILSPTRAMRRVLLSALAIHFFHQATGIDSVVLYSPRVFQRAGVVDNDRLLGATCAVGVAKMLFILVATFLVDRGGRRPLLLGSIGGMVASLVGLGAGLTVVDRSSSKVAWALALCIASNVALVSSFSAGFGPVAFVYTSEIFPLRVRALGSALCVAINRVTAAVVTMTFLSLSRAITIGGAFFLYAGIAVLAWVFVFTCLPETRGRTLEGMGKLFGMADDGSNENDDATTEKAVEISTN